MLTAEGRTPPSAVYRASLPTGIPMPCEHFKGDQSKWLKLQIDYKYTGTVMHLKINQF